MDTKINIEKVLNTLQSGGLVIFPSDTVYGLLADATNEKAVHKLIEFKNRPPGKAISIFVADFPMLKEYVYINQQQEKVLKQIFPGPFTVILPSQMKTVNLLESEKKTLGVRIPNYSPITELIRKFNKPVTATSANLAGDSPHYSVDTLLKSLSKKKRQLIDLIIDTGKLPHNKPSTVIDLTTPELQLLRYGDVLTKTGESFISDSPHATSQIARLILNKVKANTEKPLIFILQGELGVGKTVFVKGLAESFGINNVISPTFVVYYEYEIKNNNYKKFVHVDLYNIEKSEEFTHLGIEKYTEDANIICFEWGEKLGEIFQVLKKRGRVVYVNMKYLDDKRREIKFIDNYENIKH